MNKGPRRFGVGGKGSAEIGLARGQRGAHGGGWGGGWRWRVAGSFSLGQRSQ